MDAAAIASRQVPQERRAQRRALLAMVDELRETRAARDLAFENLARFELGARDANARP